MTLFKPVEIANIIFQRYHNSLLTPIEYYLSLTFDTSSMLSNDFLKKSSANINEGIAKLHNLGFSNEVVEFYNNIWKDLLGLVIDEKLNYFFPDASLEQFKVSLCDYGLGFMVHNGDKVLPYGKDFENYLYHEFLTRLDDVYKNKSNRYLFDTDIGSAPNHYEALVAG